MTASCSVPKAKDSSQPNPNLKIQSLSWGKKKKRTSMDIKHPQILVVRRKMDCVLLKRRKERQITLTDWAKGCAGSGPALISRLGHPSLHQAPLARCLNPRRWPWQLREAPLEGRNLQHSTVTCSTRLVVNPATGWAEGFAYLPKQGGGARSCVGFSAKAPDDPVSSCC